MANSLAPAFIKINYTTPYGTHVQTVPSVPIVAGVYAPSGYKFDLRGAEIDVEMSEAVADFVSLEAEFFEVGTTFTDFTAYTQASPTDIPTPVYSGTLNISGTGVFDGWAKAVQMTWTWRADDFTIFKLALMDTPTANSFAKTTNPADDGTFVALDDYVTADATWVASRGGGRPSTFLQISRTLNEKLRRAYNLT